jgi:hypothetical protein
VIQRIVLDLTPGGASFGESLDESNAEVARTLRKLADQFEHGRHDPMIDGPSTGAVNVQDTNGNTVGVMRVSHT